MSTAPKVVAIGGGHGTAVTLRAATRYAAQVTAIVSVADDGGSSGRLRELLDGVARGAMRKCLVALAAETPLATAFAHRFEEGELAGHALGNLVLAGLVAATGDLVAAVDEAARLLGAVGRVLPATTEPVVLKADSWGGEVEGQVAVSRAGRIRSVSIVPSDAGPPPCAVEAILDADQVVIGPGSLYTSLLAAASVPAVADAIGRTAAQRVFVCNLRPQIPETEGYDLGRHVSALEAHGVAIDRILCDT
ncbi:MAG: gluconeogenesis factor YvcK family protein, partial [Acidimicrobiales bacterium]